MHAPPRRALLLASAAATLPTLPAVARPSPPATPASVAAAYDAYADTYDDLDGGPLARALGLPGLRAAAAARARGDVLEVAVGTGLGLEAHWTAAEGGRVPPADAELSLPPGVTSLTLVDASPHMLAAATARASTLRLAATALVADVAALPLESESFDTVLDAFALCVFPDPPAALAEMARVLRRGGSAILIENARSRNAVVGAWQDAVAGGAAVAGGKGCRFNVDVPALIAATPGLELVEEARIVGGVFGLFCARRV